MTDNEILAAGELVVVGSVLNKRKPRDIDLVLVLPAEIFVTLFGPTRAWNYQGETGLWGKARHRWSATCVRISKELGRRMAIAKPVDFKIVPSTMRHHGKG